LELIWFDLPYYQYTKIHLAEQDVTLKMKIAGEELIRESDLSQQKADCGFYECGWSPISICIVGGDKKLPQSKLRE
jgi:hypothetical protein